MTERAFKYRFYPTPDQENLLRRTLGCVRLIYNKALAHRAQAWSEKKEKINYNQTSALLTSWKQLEELKFLNEISAVPLQQSLRHLQKAFNNFWNKTAKPPRFKKKSNGGSAEFTKAAFRWKEGQIWLAKCSEPLAVRWSRPLPVGSTPSTITVKLDASGRWFVCLLVKDETIQALAKTAFAVGIDLGITSLITTSEGNKIGNPKHLNRLQKKLRRVQKALSRTQKDSKNQEKARLKVARVHAQITDSRKDFLHKLTTQLVRENQTIVVEDLAVRNLLKNPKLAQAIAECGWSELVTQLQYKCQWYSKEFKKIDRFFPSSKTCGKCGHVLEKLPLNIRQWTCPECGVSHDRDVNAAHNILAAGLAVSVCGATVRPNENQSPRAGAKPPNHKGRSRKPNREVWESPATPVKVSRSGCQQLMNLPNPLL